MSSTPMNSSIQSAIDEEVRIFFTKMELEGIQKAGSAAGQELNEDLEGRLALLKTVSERFKRCLAGKRADLNKELNVHKSPIYALPNEIIVQVFDRGLDIRDTIATEHLHTLAQVSTRWARIVKSTPRLWRHIDVTGRLGRISLQRSGQTPLRLTIPGAASLARGFYRYQQALSRYREDHYRWEALSIAEVNCWRGDWSLTSAITEGITELPVLEEADFLSARGLTSPKLFDGHPPLALPKLRRVKCQTAINWKALASPTPLRALCMDSRALAAGAMGEFLDALRDMPLLEDLRITRCKTFEDSFARPMGRRAAIEVPNLTYFSIVQSPGCGPYILEHLRAPRPLKRLVCIVSDPIRNARPLLGVLGESELFRRTLESTTMMRVKADSQGVTLDAGSAVNIQFLPREDRAMPSYFFSSRLLLLDYPTAPPVCLDLDMDIHNLSFLQHYPSLDTLSFRTPHTWRLIEYLMEPQSVDGALEWVAPKLRKIILHFDVACNSKKITGGLLRVIEVRKAAASRGLKVNGEIEVHDEFSGWRLDVQRREFVKLRTEVDVQLDILKDW